MLGPILLLRWSVMLLNNLMLAYYAQIMLCSILLCSVNVHIDGYKLDVCMHTWLTFVLISDDRVLLANNWII